ncbi:AbrB/MazE/SpoVT family DNA-binding domain-containing protein [candidate division CSSED10-310 bacterium]|uniref:AbrB/MazE/SpoVT family DNA-binding domain-containing protein n=1 Tax=candidate division CSSED10-310 bacterium TaxID=2855610 RepID=A0ABV6Z441_UNCC1
MAVIAKVGNRGQITIPRSIRRMMQLEKGDSIAFIKQNNDVFIYPLNKTLFDIRGIIPVKEPQNFTKIRQKVIQKRIRGKLHNAR